MSDLSALTAVESAAETRLVAALAGAPGSLSVTRRCADLGELLATATGGRGQVAFVSATLPRLDRDSIALLVQSEVAVVGVVDQLGTDRPGSEEEGTRRLRALGIDTILVVTGRTDAAAIEAAARAALAALTSAAFGISTEVPAAQDFLTVTPRSLELALAPSDAGATSDPGRLVAVWGPVGSPGRTVVALNLAAELAATGRDALLVDADTYGASIAQSLAILDEAPGVAAACRSAAAGSLDPAVLARLAPFSSDHLRVLTGITRADRWPELSRSGLDLVWDHARQVSPFTVVDTGFCLETDEELTYDTFAPQRNAATLSALEAADEVVAVGSADAVGLARLVRGLNQLRDAVPTCRPRVVVTRVRAAVIGPDPAHEVREALRRHAGVTDAVLMPDDRAALDKCLLAGRPLAHVAPKSAARRSLAQLAGVLAGPPVVAQAPVPQRRQPQRRRFSIGRLAAAR